MIPVRLRLDVVSPSDVDRGLCEAGRLTLERNDQGTFAEVDAALVDRVRAVLGRCGVSARPADRSQVDASDVPAAARDLEPLRVSGITDRVSLRTIAIGDATRLTRRGLFRRYDADRLRTLLRDEDRAYAWRRIVWMPRALVRARELRGVRPIVFDRAAVASGNEHWGFARAEQLARWIAG